MTKMDLMKDYKWVEENKMIVTYKDSRKMQRLIISKEKML